MVCDILNFQGFTTLASPVSTKLGWHLYVYLGELGIMSLNGRRRLWKPGHGDGFDAVFELPDSLKAVGLLRQGLLLHAWNVHQPQKPGLRICEFGGCKDDEGLGALEA